ncbi:multidrug efflux transcriptional repressor AdeN, partial [Acinetobacter baumannii]|nr:multidrug efflux transcriptional repressor AdeN [Acinetobacter baumannii]
MAFQPEQTSLKDYLIQTLIRFYKHIIQPEHIAFLRLVIEQTQCNATLSQYLYEKCALDVQNTIAQALLISHQSGEITCTSPDHSSLMYFGILRDIEWRMIMGMPLPPNETEVID